MKLGVCSGPFIAIAAVHALVQIYAETFPNTVRKILHNMYVDDCLTGAETCRQHRLKRDHDDSRIQIDKMGK